MIRFDCLLWQRFRAVAAPYWSYENKWQARGLLALLVLLLLGQTGFAVLFNLLTGEFTSALAAKDADRFWTAIAQCVGILIVAVPIYAFYYFVRDKLGLNQRRWLTRNFLGSYFRNRAYYELNASSEIDNPDQRVAEDINTFTQKSLQFLLVLVGALLQLIAFSGVLWSISRELVAFLIMPRYAILDEATSALDIANEDSLYRQLAASNTTLISVGHRPSILKYHPQVLELTGDGGWWLYTADDYRISR